MPDKPDLTVAPAAQPGPIPVADLGTRPRQPVDMWGVVVTRKGKQEKVKRRPIAATITVNNFKYKSLSSWAYNIAVGCNHACRFCYVPSASANKQEKQLKRYGILEPDADWGNYVLLRQWNEKRFLASLNRAQNLPPEELDEQGNRVERKSNKGHKRDGNRAVILCSTTDPYQVISVENDDGRKVILQALRGTLVRKALELILKHSTINVRILTRSPLAKQDFDLYKEFGPRLLFGMSLPTLNDDIRKLYEPKAPGVKARQRVLEEAKAAGLHVYVAMAPTSPECQEEDLESTLTWIKTLKPVTVFQEPINIRADNVARIAKHAEELKVPFNARAFLPENWPAYALWQLHKVEEIAKKLKLDEHLHLWPDKALGGRRKWEQARRVRNLSVTDPAFDAHQKWLQKWWTRISEWPR